MSTKGQTIRVDPLKSLKEVAAVKYELKDSPRNLAIFVTGTNTALRASDLVRLTRQQVRHLKPGDHITLKMKKTSKFINVTLNKEVVEIIQPLLVDGDGPLFENENFPGKSISEKYLSTLVQEWCRKARLKGRYGSHTLRKSHAYIQRTVFNVEWAIISQILGHSSMRETMLYLGVQPEEVRDAFMNGI